MERTYLMAAYNTPEAVADYLARFQMTINEQGKGTFSPSHVKYYLTLEKDGKTFDTTYESNPEVHGKPTISQVFAALMGDATMSQSYDLDSFVDEFVPGGMKPSQAIRAYESCKETYDWMRDELYLTNGELASISEMLDENEPEVAALTEKLQAERAARRAIDHPEVPEGFVTIESLQEDLDLGDYGDYIEDFDFDGYLSDQIAEFADGKVDITYSALLAWLPDHAEWLERAEENGLLEGCKGDIYKMIQAAQYECIQSDLYEHEEDICRYGTLEQLKDSGIYAIKESLAKDILGDLDFNGGETCEDEAKDAIVNAIYAEFEEKFGEEFAETGCEYFQDTVDIAEMVNPCALSITTTRAVNEKGYDAAFGDSWANFLSENEMELPATSLDKEARDAKKSQDALAGDAQGHTAPELAADAPRHDPNDGR